MIYPIALWRIHFPLLWLKVALMASKANSTNITRKSRDNREKNSFLIFLIIKKCVLIFERDRKRESGGGAETEGGKESQAGSTLSAQSLMGT